MFRKKHYLALGAVTLVASADFQPAAARYFPLQTCRRQLFLPLFGLLSTAQQLPGDAADCRSAPARIAQGN